MVGVSYLHVHIHLHMIFRVCMQPLSPGGGSTYVFWGDSQTARKLLFDGRRKRTHDMYSLDGDLCEWAA